MTGAARADGWKRSVRWVAFCVGLVLLAGACLAVWREREGLARAWASAGEGKYLLVGATILFPCVNWLLTSVMFWALMPRGEHSRLAVGLGEMIRLIGAAWLANYLPARPGFFGRLAYHKAVNEIPVPKALVAMIAALACGGVAAGVALGLAVWFRSAPWVLAMPAVTCLMLAALFRVKGGVGRVSLALAARYLDVLVWMGRYAAAFALVGRPLSAPEAAAMAGVSQIAMLVPFVGNGLGVREWAIRWAAPALPVWFAGSAAVSGSVALSADLMNRAGEIIAAIPVGLLCGAAVAARVASLTPRAGP